MDLEKSGPNRLADQLRDDLDEAYSLLEVATTRAERSELNKRIFRTKNMITWCGTRAGYVHEEPNGKAA